jgi:DNA-binding GntR family transcriptional regulator
VPSNPADAKSLAAKSEPTQPLRTVIYEQLVDDIMRGRISAGERLSEAALVQRFCVSKTPIREAFIQMEREGYIVLRKNAGAVVQKVSTKMVQDIFTIVAVLESYAAEAVVADGKFTKRDIAHLAKLVSAMKQRAKRREYQEYRSLNVEFHGYFVEKLGNETLKLKIVDLRKRMYGFVSGGLTLPVHIDRYVKCHEQILDAVKNNSALKAAKLMRDHVMESRDFLVATLGK